MPSPPSAAPEAGRPAAVPQSAEPMARECGECGEAAHRSVAGWLRKKLAPSSVPTGQHSGDERRQALRLSAARRRGRRVVAIGRHRRHNAVPVEWRRHRLVVLQQRLGAAEKRVDERRGLQALVVTQRFRLAHELPREAVGGRCHGARAAVPTAASAVAAAEREHVFKT
eukprot:scaffold33928_cov57-Phaeocystis_antarctica.AAC.1